MNKISDELMRKYELPTFDEFQKLVDDGIYPDFYELYNSFLIKTDHIPNKIIEQLIEDLASASLLDFIGVFIDFIKNIRSKYNEVLLGRKLCREEIAKLEESSKEEVTDNGENA